MNEKCYLWPNCPCVSGACASGLPDDGCPVYRYFKKLLQPKPVKLKGYIMPVCELLAGLAEECGELTQASLKLRRVWDGTNPTPASEEVAMEGLYEEVADVLLYIEELKLNRGTIGRIMGEKRERWKKRLEGKP